MGGRVLRRRAVVNPRSARQALLARLSEVEAAWSRLPARSRAGPGPPLADLRECAERLSACLADEAARIHPLIQTHLPVETGTLEVVRDEHATLQNLVQQLHQRMAAVERRQNGAEAAVDVILGDLVDLWRTHVRRFDRGIDPLLRRLEQTR